MICSQAELLAPLYLSGELDAESGALLAQHLESCRQCAASLESQRQLDDVLRAAALRRPVNEGPVVERVRAEISPAPVGPPPIPRKIHAAPVALAAMGALLMVVILVLNFVERRNARAVFERASAPPTTIYTEAAEDHHDEVVEHYRRKWLRGDDAINQLVAQKVGNAAVLAALAPAGYRVDRVRVCELGVRDYLHLVYSDGRHEISFFLRQQDGEQLEGGTVAQAGGASLHSASADNLQVAGFQAQRYTVVIVSDQSADDTLHFASKAAESVGHMTAVLAPALLTVASAVAAI